ncbi:hypothetical protein ILUMI_02649 [Ignelater luminosus]|uniref:C2H2-type domain-containing protein n=1 Tax=Ignelater luminosus TaxID=2038154 RepID=A0A8K0GMZ8_IGNLU|nr:hypothetical protein ILUMI_02649 [Ignelater luminosus]
MQALLQQEIEDTGENIFMTFEQIFDYWELAEKANVSHICFQCGKVYKFARSLRRHLTYECQKEPQQVCPVCNKRTHLKKLHTVIDLPVQIELTEADTKDTWLGWTSPPDAIAQDGVSHKKRKSTSSSNRIRGNFGCVQCGRSYNRKDSLQRHLTYECGKDPQFQCPFCPQKCKRRAHQMRHIRRQHKDKIGLLEENNPDLLIRKQI